MGVSLNNVRNKHERFKSGISFAVVSLKRTNFAKSKQEKTMNVQDLERQLGSGRQWEVSSTFPVLMRKVYVWMTMALAITAITAYGVATSPLLMQTIFSNQILFWGLIIAEFGLVIWLSARLHKLSLSTATLLFILYSVVNGATLSVIFLAYSMSSIATTFLVTSGTFGIMAAYGYFTKKDLTSWGRLLMMALIGLIIAVLVNIFLKNSMMDMIVSGIGVLIFTGLTAYDSQKIKNWLIGQEYADEGAQKFALMGALTLYLDFINLFLYLLRFLGRRE